MSERLAKASLKLPLEVPASGCYVVAVSGGVDSVTLLHELMVQNQGQWRLVVAHFDHGMRLDSAADKEFVAGLARDYGLVFESRQGNLGQAASEALARSARYKFLNEIKENYQAAAIITAHHLDDRIETLLLNLERGTGRYGVAPFKSSIIRPLRYIAKPDLVNYAKRQHLVWQEDPTNTDSRYRRNYIRHQLLPKLLAEQPGLKQVLGETIAFFEQANQALDAQLEKLSLGVATVTANKINLRRSKLIMLEPVVCRQLLYYLLRQLYPSIQVKAFKLVRLEHFCKTARVGKKLQFEQGLSVTSRKQIITIELTAVKA